MELLGSAIGLLALLCLSPAATAQQFSITAGSITTCAGVLEDSGGPAASYGNNENFTAVICPDQPGDAISLMWAIFTLNTTGPNPLDRIRIWDGNSTSETFLGEYTGTALQGLIVSATTFNSTGCLTVQFISNANGVGDFAASITCFTPCERPTAVAFMNEAVPAMICQGETVQFDGTGSYAATGFNIVSYTWDFDDGTTATGPTASHAFTVPGEYIVQLNLIDNNDCVNSNVVDLQILVSTTPSFSGTIESTESCLGAIVDLSAVVTPTTWTGIPEANFGDGVYLPDDVGTPFTSTLSFTQFNPGQTLTNVSDLLSVCVSMEHSFMGDLVLSLTCPSGQNIIFHQQGGGGTYIGGANDGDNNNNPVPGTCWNYCWSPTATNGTWVQSVAAGMTMLGGTPPNNALIPGTYSSVQPFSNLVGCPLNGTWTFTSLDLWGADNGFLCNWSMNFNPAIIPDVTQFTPDLGTTTQDSAFWSGPFLVLDPNNPLNATANPTAAGSYDYTFQITDNFGCAYDTTITVTVNIPMEVEAGPDIILCNDPLPMAGQVVTNAPSNCVWVLQLNESFGDTWNGGANLQVNNGGVITNHAITTNGTLQQLINLNITNGTTVTLTYTAGTIWNSENSFSLINDLGQVVYASPQGPPTGVAWTGTVNCLGTTVPPHVFAWTPATGLVSASDPLTNVFVTQPTMFYLSLYPVGFPECAVVDSVLVSPDPSINAGENNTIVLCANEPSFQLTDSLNGTPDAGGVWRLNGVVVPGLFNPNTGAQGTYIYTVTSQAGCVATAQLSITIIPVEDPSCCGIADAGEPSFSCDLSINLSASPGNTGVGNWTGPAGAVFQDIFSPQTAVTMPVGSGGTHTFYWIEDDGAFCYLIDSVQKTFTDEIIITITSTDAICFSYCDGTAQSTVTGGNIAGGYGFNWSSGVGSNTAAVTGLCAGDFSLTVSDDNGCNSTATFTIGQPVLLEIDSLASQPVTCSGWCDGQIEIYDAEAVEYSYNDGATWTTSPVRPNSCEAIYTIRIRDAIGCEGTGAIAVTGPPPVLANFEWGPQNANVDAPLVYFNNTSENADTYLWDIAGLLESTVEDPVFLFDNRDPNFYTVCLIAYNYNMCSDTICQIVDIEDVLFVYIPNAFTPNGDNLNEGFMMSTNIDVITDFRMEIFDRWGNVIFQTTDPEQPWLGSYNNGGEIVNTGVYAYRISYEIKYNQARRELRGHVTLLK
jgi:gliding motility-associated-like protein